ncbi:MAG: competence/damage-inducible protein A [Lachnospiraceae bacterium]|nr:competence/damage-inducible protein A [Lachnospiraceae bacterium]
MIVELISVGTEILLGNIVNTNAAYLSEQCAALGLSCYFQSVVGDNEERLTLVLKTAMDRADIVILSGGLGPTEDDLTKETAAKVCGRKLVLDEKWKKRIATYFAAKNITPTENNWKQAMVPKNALVLDNLNGTAPGLIIEEKNAKVILLPGPPGELIPLFENSVRPYLETLTNGALYSQTVKICGVGESMVETRVKDLIDAQTNPTLATYAKTGEVHLRVTAFAENVKEAKKLTKPIVKELKARFGVDIYTTEEQVTLEKAVLDLLAANGLTLTCAEACTGGLLASRLVSVPGCSDVFKSCVVPYSNKAKRKLLGVKKSSLQKYGAVSAKVAEEMAKGAVFTSKCDAAVSVTGIAGPDGGSEEKPVGTVFIGCIVKGKLTVKEFHFSGNRQKIRESTVAAALTLLRSGILEYIGKIAFGKE